MSERYSIIETTSPTGAPRFIIRGRRPRGVPGAKQINSTITAKKGQDKTDIRGIAENKIRSFLLEDAQFATMRKPLATVMSAEQVEDAEFAYRLLAQRAVDASLSDIVELGIKEWRPTSVPAILEECKLLYLAWRERRGLYDTGGRQSSTKSVIERLGVFFGEKSDLSALRPVDVAAFFNSPLFVNERQWGQARVLSSFLNFLIERPDQTSDCKQPLLAFNPAKEVANEMKDLYSTKPKTVIWSVEQVEKNLAFAESFRGGEGAAYLALAVFAGLRPDRKRGEITRITPADYDPSTRSIEVPGGKTGFRQVDVSENLAAWLDAYGVDRIIPPWNSRVWGEFRKSCNWSHDVTRHTCISMWLETHAKEEDRAIYMFGNGDRIRNKHYRRKVTPLDADRFWNVIPKKGEAEMIKFPT